jgi:hypothetical protein
MVKTTTSRRKEVSSKDSEQASRPNPPAPHDKIDSKGSGVTRIKSGASSELVPESFAEVIASSLTTFDAQCWQWDNFPQFGELVHVNAGDRTIFGLVVNTTTGSSEQGRTPHPYQKTETELREQQPHIFAFLKTIFTVQIVGYREKTEFSDRTKSGSQIKSGTSGQSETSSGQTKYLIPPTPCKIHAFVRHTHPAQSEVVLVNHDFLQLLFAFSSAIPSLDELLLVVLHNRAHAGTLTQDTLQEMSQEFSLHIGNDYRRLKRFLRRLEVILEQTSAKETIPCKKQSSSQVAPAT